MHVHVLANSASTFGEWDRKKLIGLRTACHCYRSTNKCMHIFFDLCIFNETGGSTWPSGVFLKYTAGDQLGPVNMVSVKPLDAGEYYDLSVNMISPGKTGMYQGQWRMCTPTGQYFGGKVKFWSLLFVVERYRI